MFEKIQEKVIIDKMEGKIFGIQKMQNMLVKKKVKQGEKIMKLSGKSIEMEKMAGKVPKLKKISRKIKF